MQYKVNQLKNASLSIDYEDCAEGCKLICGISEGNKNLFEFKLLAGNRTQAELLGEQISVDPSAFYSNFIDYILHKKYINSD